MANISRSSIVGFHNIKNKVTRNAFDLSHRHMFTAQIGELFLYSFNGLILMKRLS